MKTSIFRHFITPLLFSLLCLTIHAQPAAVKKAAESVFTLTTFKADGTVLGSGHGVFVGNNGEAVSNLKPFLGAVSAVVIDSKGKKMNVVRMMGVNDIYDVAHFRVDGTTRPAEISATATARDKKVWLVGYSVKSPVIEETTVKNVEKFNDKYSYYILSSKASDNMEACPYVNDVGRVIGLMQPSTTSGEAHATDAGFIRSLKTDGMSINNSTFKSIGIPSALPADKDQALLTLMMSSQMGDSLKYAAIVDDFIAQYPNQTEGYNSKAYICLAANKMDDAKRNMETAIAKAPNKDEAHYNYAKLIYQKEISKQDVTYPAWSLDKALEEALTAYSISPLAVYRHLEAQILFSKQDYQKAYDIFIDLSQGKMESAEMYYEAALCKQQLGAADEELLALLDSAVNNLDSINVRDAAPYFLMRGNVYNSMKNYRQAVFDYARCEILSQGKLTAEFYYMKEQAEINAKLFKQAIGDITNAIYLAPSEPMYHAERASLLLRVNMPKDAIDAAKYCIKIAPEYSDGYLLLGLAQVKTDNKAEGIANMKKAKELGNDQAQALIDKYSK